ncbi:MAG: hypothetical protein JWN75_722 [Candidatus Saccharibacteria bacterium]|nr:hypothetical protein [Candidatus Saccharibacteria bacterium]
MRKTINILAFIFLFWVVLDTYNTPSILLNFLLVGQLPGMNATVSPSMMLAIMTAIGGVVVFEILARRIEVIWQIRQQLRKFIERRERLPRRRFSRI